jgi:hypothetical protein
MGTQETQVQGSTASGSLIGMQACAAHMDRIPVTGMQMWRRTSTMVQSVLQNRSYRALICFLASVASPFTYVGMGEWGQVLHA